MKKCNLCGIEFKTHVHINGKYRNFGNRKYCLTCSPFGEGNRIKLHTPKSKEHNNTKCEICSAYLKGNAVKFCSKTCKSKSYAGTTETNNYAYQQGRALTRKLAFIKLLGGACYCCGYKKNLAALHFHHQDSKTKKFSIDSRALSNTSLKRLEEEMEKCELLCANCHAEKHYPYMNLDTDALSSLL